MNTPKNILTALTVSALTTSMTFATDSQPQAGPNDDSYQAPVLQGDINNDGAAGIDDLWAVIEAWGEHKNRPRADIAPAFGNKVDALDLALVISNWGT